MEWFKTIQTLPLIYWIMAGAVLLLLIMVCRKLFAPKLKKMTARDDIRGYALIYADQKAGKRGTEDFGKLLYSAKYELQGKPDYVFRSRVLGKIVPVELKSGSIGEEEKPHYGDYLQLCTYFLILEDVYGKRPAFGRLVYRDYMFEVKNTAKVRQEVLQTVTEMRQMLKSGMGTPNSSFAHCRPCICNGTVCTFSKADTKGEEK